MGILWLKRILWTIALCCATGLATGSVAAPGAVLVAHTNDLSAAQAAHTPLAPVVEQTVVYVPAAVYSAPEKPTATPAAPVSSGGRCSADPTMAAKIACCESGGSPTARNSSGAAGKYQYMSGTWGGYGGYASADQAPASVQDQKFQQDTASGNYGPWTASRSCWG